MIRRLIAGLIVVGLGVGVWALWPRGDADTTPTTVPTAVGSTTTTTTTTTVVTSTSEANTTTTSEDSNVVTTVEEAEAILRELWFGWFEGIYNQDEDRIKEVVGTQAMLDQARASFGAAFTRVPTDSDINFGSIELLRTDRQCIAVWASIDVSAFRGEGSISNSLVIIRRDGANWKLATTWTDRNDRWEADCDSQLEPVS